MLVPVLRRAARPTLLAIALLSSPFVPSHAQGATATQVVRFEVRPVFAVRELSPLKVVARTSTEVDVATTVVIDANTGYRVVARAVDAASAGAVLIRTADGSFTNLAPDFDVTVVVEHQLGRTTHDIVCRVPTGRALAGAPAGCGVALQFVTDDDAIHTAGY